MKVHRLHQQAALEPDTMAQPALQHDEAPQAEFDLRSLLRVFMARRWTILGTIAICLTLAGIVVVQMTPIYSASTLLMVGQRENKVLDQESFLAGLPMDSATIENQIQILRSWSLAERVVLKLNLTRDPEFDPSRAEGSLLSNLNPLTWFASPKRKITAGANEKVTTVDPAILRRFGAKLTVAAQGRSSVIKVTFDSPDREKAAMIANALADQYIVDQLETKFDAAKRTTDWLNERLGQLAEQVRASESAVEQYKTEHDLTDGKGGNSLANEQLSELNGQIVLARSNLAEQEAKYKQVNSLYNAGSNVDSIASVINSPLISTLRGQQAELMRKEAELATKYGDRHPQMIALRDERKNLDAKIEEEVKRIIRNLSNEVSIARARLSSLESSLREIQGTANTQGKASIKLRELERDAQANRTLYDTFQARFKATEDKDQIQTPDARTIQKAAVPLDPSYPNKPLIMGVTLFGAGVMGMLLALMLERLDNGFRIGPEIERATRLSNLAVVPAIKGAKHVADRVIHKPLSVFSESIRSLYAGLQLSNVDKPPKVVVITSAVPNEGKTSLAVSLGRLAAKSGARVLLIDGDLRHPSVGAQFSPRPPEAGLVEVLAGKRDLAGVLMRDPISTLEFVAVAAPPANPADLLASLAMKSLLQALRDHYDLIIIDAAPVLPVSDTRMLARLADKVIFAVRWDATPREAVLSGIKLLRDANADIAGTVLTQADLRRHAIYGYGNSAYGYGGNYAKYYSE
ncbi:MAG: polysaccharide biosynthesis tyrosine autokinase [Alphaproteobacteria bacterium]|nr:polysaccharide biosynthesis tyrosine autokinase [Alphaproteobacteria bacterium]